MGKIGFTGVFLALIIATIAPLLHQPLQLWILDRVRSFVPAPEPVETAPALDEQGCSHPEYVTRILSNNPLVMHVENFLTKAECEHLIKIGEPLYQESLTQGLKEGDAQMKSESRTSRSAFLPRADPIHQCVLNRAAEFQGYIPQDWIEDLQITAYTTGQQYIGHYDWGMPPDWNNGRQSTFFGILDANCTNCGTKFERIRFPWGKNETGPCKYVECEEEFLVVKPNPGSAVFWRNLNHDGSGHEDTLHAGMPLQDGYKIGLNIWTRGKTWWTYDTT